VDLNALTGGDPGRSILAVRALAGLAQGAGEFSLPPDQRFYGGGSGTIRGYAYQAVGAQFTGTDIPIGGTAIIAGSVEFRQRVGTDFGVAVFVDGGQVSASLKPLPDVLRFGVGAGLRYYTPIGPIRFDLAVPTQRDSGDGAFQIYIGLGQAF
jgi:translocation and assembly module TamA